MARPLKYTPGDFNDSVENYFVKRIDGITGKYKEVPTKSSLLIELDISRETWSEYKRREEFVDTIKRAELLIEEAWVQRLTGHNVTGAIFYLKNAFKEHYKDRKETDITSDGKALNTFDDKQLQTIADRILSRGRSDGGTSSS